MLSHFSHVPKAGKAIVSLVIMTYPTFEVFVVTL